MVKIRALYQGSKHCELVHEPSQSKIETDAPKDNQGKGERFSPTDLVGAALVSCVLTTMAIVATHFAAEKSRFINDRAKTNIAGMENSAKPSTKVLWTFAHSSMNAANPSGRGLLPSSEFRIEINQIDKSK